jgi:hypothetical protein
MKQGRVMAVTFWSALVAVVAASALAMRRVPAAERTPVEDLPEWATCGNDDPTPGECEAAGGTVRYRQTAECFNEPSVYDVCEFGVMPCFVSGDGHYCRDAKDTYCGCEAADQCPDGYECQFDLRSGDGQALEPIAGTGQCRHPFVDSTGPARELRSKLIGL